MDVPTDTMQCARIAGCRQALRICDDDAAPSTPEYGVLLKTLYGGICHSDIHIIDGTENEQGEVINDTQIQLGDAFEGVVLGHEVCGQVLEVGKRVPRTCQLKPGDRVLVYPWRGCHECETCSGGSSQLCEQNPCGCFDIGQGYHPGGYASMIAIPEAELCVRLPSEIPTPVACMLSCSGLTAYSAIKAAKPYLDAAIRTRGMANLLVVGMGGLGLWSVIIIKSVYCDKNVKVICADISEDKLDMAAGLGADDRVLWDKNEQDISVLVQATTVAGYNLIDAAIDFVGSSITSQVSLKSLHRGACLILIGLHGSQLKLSTAEMISRSIAIIGVRCGSQNTFEELVDLVAVQRLDKYPPIELVHLKNINEVLDRLRKGQVKGRAIIKY